MRKPSHRSRFALGIVAATFAVIAAGSPVAAAAPQQVTIVSHVTFNPDGPNYGDFDASGTAVDDEVICPSGTFVDTGIRFAGFQSPRGVVQLQVAKTFTCSDGSGTFDLKMQIQADFGTGIESFRWVITGGTGAYGSLRGGGGGTTVPNAPIGNINTFEGVLVN
jgi:hypothetical protein